MKVVKINKNYRNGTKEHFLVLLDEPYSNDDIDYLVEEWCESEGSGMNYGYTYEWWFVKDDKLINTILKDKIKIAEREIETLKTKKCEMESNLITVYKRAMQYCVAKFGEEPDELHLLEDGSFKVIYQRYARGEYTEEEYFDESCLTQDLDSVYEERKKAEEEAREKQRIENEKREVERKKREQEQRKEMYLKLKAEFES